MEHDDLRGDSPEFTELEATTAVAVSTVSDMIAWLQVQQCRECGEAQFPRRHEQRRRANILYCRVILACAENHETSVVLRVDALQNRDS